MTDIDLVQQLEERSRLEPRRVVRLKGTTEGEPFELLIFRGFSSSTTHPTAFDPDASVLPPSTRLEQAELLQGPLNPSEALVLAGPFRPCGSAGSGQLVSSALEYANAATAEVGMVRDADPRLPRNASSGRIWCRGLDSRR